MGSSIGEMGRAVRMLVKSPGFAIFARCGIPQASPLNLWRVPQIHTWSQAFPSVPGPKAMGEGWNSQVSPFQLPQKQRLRKRIYIADIYFSPAKRPTLNPGDWAFPHLRNPAFLRGYSLIRAAESALGLCTVER